MGYSQIKAGAILNYVIIGLNTLVGLLFTPYMLRCLGQNEYGLYAIVSSVIAYLTLLDFGFGNAIIRFTAKFRAEANSDRQWDMFGMFILVFSAIGFIAFLCGMGLYFNVDTLFDRTMSPDDLRQARIMMLLLTCNLTFTFPLSIFGSIISAYENFVFQRVVNIARILLSTAVMIALLSIGYKAIAIVVVQTIFSLAVLTANMVYCFKKLKIRVRFRKINIPLLKEISAYSFWIFLNEIMNRIYWSSGQFVLGSICGTVAVAVFSVAILLQQMYMTFSTAISGVLLPRVTSMVAQNRSTREISDLFILTGRIQYLVIALITSGFIVFGRLFINQWVGTEYSTAYTITLIFFLSLLTPLIQNTGITILQARNQLRFRSLLYLFISIFSLVLQILLAKPYGPVGCAVAIGGALIIGNGLIMNIYYSVSQSIDIKHFWIEIAKLSLIPIVFTAIGYHVVDSLRLSSWTSLTSGIILYLLLYLPAIWFVGMNRYEKNLVIKPFSKLIASRHL